MSTAAAPKPNPERLFTTLFAYQQTYALKAAVELDIFSLIGEGADDAAKLAERLRVPERGVRILADYLTTYEFLRKENGKYVLSPDSAVFLDRKSPAYMGGMAGFLAGDESVKKFSMLADAVRKGGTAWYEGDNSKPMDGQWVNFARSMGSMAVPMAGILSRMIGSSSGPVRLLDIAAGHGMYGIMVAKTDPNITVTALDWPAVLEVAKENAAKLGVSSRYEPRPGSAFDTDLGQNYDYIFITNFLHHFDIPTCEMLLKRFHAALKPGGKAFTVEFVPNEDRVSPQMAARFPLVMLANTDAGDAYTFSEYQKMFGAAGFRHSSLHQVPDLPEQVIVSER
jgi:hypothetical protein